MTVQDFIVTESPGERAKAAPNGLRISMNRDYATDLVRRITEKLDDEKGDVGFVMFGEIVEG